MKNYLLITLFLISVNSFSQSSKVENGYYMPKVYLDSLIKYGGKKTFNEFIKPIECIQIENGSVSVLTFGGEFSDVESIKTNSKIEILNINSLLNLGYFSPLSYSQSKFFLSMDKDKLLLEIKDGKGVDSVLFVNRVGGYELQAPNVTYFRLIIPDRYVLKDTSNAIIASDINLKIDGEIQNCTSFISFSIDECYVENNNTRNFYGIIRLNSPTEKKHRSYAFTKIDNQILLYNYEDLYQDYRILLKERVFILERSN